MRAIMSNGMDGGRKDGRMAMHKVKTEGRKEVRRREKAGRMGKDEGEKGWGWRRGIRWGGG